MKSSLFLVVTVLACGGTQQEAAKDPGPAAAGSAAPVKPTASGDVSFDVQPAIDVKGVVYEPEALGRPGIPLVEPKGAMPPIDSDKWKALLAKERALATSSKDPVVKQANAGMAATMLYRKSKSDKANEGALLKDARQIMLDAAQAAGDKEIDEVTLQLLGAYQILLEDYPAAEKAWQGLIDKDPKNKDNPQYRAWLVFAQLKQFKNAEALASANAEKLDEKQPELAYATAWAKLRTGDKPGAWQAINVAAKGWGQNANHDDLEKEFFFFAARGDVPVDQAVAALSVLLPPQLSGPAKLRVQYELIAKLGVLGYGVAGKWAEGDAALDQALQLGGDAAQPPDRVLLRTEQADYAVALDAPDVAARYGKQAVEAIVACDSKCPNKSDAVMRIYNLGRLFHNLFGTSYDRRYYVPAHDLYAVTIPLLPGASRNDALRVSDILEKTSKTIKPGTGTHDKNNIGALLRYHDREIEACFEAGLGANPKLGGTLTLNLETDATGAMKGVATDPKAGMADLSAVAGCVAEQAKKWKLPKRGMPGTTRIKLAYALSVKPPTPVKN